ncbi:MAG: hypothetical protein PHW43_04475 [Syntrophales bacterium]|nr:hypothetical protein [Syntrophales bacterium]
MEFKPFQEKGMPIEKQVKSWPEVNVQPYNKNEVDPYTRCRVILMNGIEVDAALFKHEFARHSADIDLNRQVAMTRKIEQEQQKMVNGLIPGDESIIKNTIGYEQLAVDLTATLAKMESDPYVKKIFDFGLLEDFDHLYRYANLLETLEGKKAEKIVGKMTEIMPGRPTIAEHRNPFDDVRKPVDMKSDPASSLNICTLVAAEQQTMNYYMNVLNRPIDPVGRGLYQEIGMIEEQHVTQYESLCDPKPNWFERLVMHEYHEVWLYHSLVQQEPDPAIKKIWKMCLEMELGHLQKAGEIFRKYQKKDPEELLPEVLPAPLILESQMEYVRDILSTQVNLTANGTDLVPVDQLPKDHRYFAYQKMVNKKFIPSQEVIREHIGKFKKDYRFEALGAHPVGIYQKRDEAGLNAQTSIDV